MLRGTEVDSARLPPAGRPRTVKTVDSLEVRQWYRPGNQTALLSRTRQQRDELETLAGIRRRR